MRLFIWRYLFAHKSHSVVNIITGVSIISIALPVAAIIILISIYNGFGLLVGSMNSMIDPQMVVVPREGSSFEIESLDTAALRQIRGVEALSFVADQMVLVEHGDRQEVVTLRGVDEGFVGVIPFDECLAVGRFEVTLGELDRLVIGNTMARQLGIRTLSDTYINIYAMKRNTFSSLLPMSNYTAKRSKLSGIFSINMESESKYIYSSLRLANELLQREGVATSLYIKLHEGANESRVMGEIEKLVGDEFDAKSRYELNPAIYDLIKYEKWGVLFISLLIMTLASFTLIGALAMLIIEKRDNMITLRAMGASWRYIRSIFFGEGLLMSGIAIGIGLVLGVSLSLVQQHYGLIQIPSNTFMVSSYPVDLQWADVMLVVLMSSTVAAALSWIVVSQMIKGEPRGSKK